MDKDAIWYGGRPCPRPRCVRWGSSSPPKKGHSSRQFSAHVCCGQTTGWIKMPLRREVDLGPGEIVLDGDLAPPKGYSPQFSVHVCCGQRAGCIKMPLGAKVDLSPGHIVLHGEPAPPGWTKMPLATMVDLGPCDIVLDGDPAPSTPERGTAAALFSAHAYYAKTVAHLSYC